MLEFCLKPISIVLQLYHDVISTTSTSGIIDPDTDTSVVMLVPQDPRGEVMSTRLHVQQHCSKTQQKEACAVERNSLWTTHIQFAYSMYEHIARHLQ